MIVIFVSLFHGNDFEYQTDLGGGYNPFWRYPCGVNRVYRCNKIRLKAKSY